MSKYESLWKWIKENKTDSFKLTYAEIEKVGMKREAHFKQNIFFHRDSDGNPIWKDTYVYTMLKEDFV